MTLFCASLFWFVSFLCRCMHSASAVSFAWGHAMAPDSLTFSVLLVTCLFFSFLWCCHQVLCEYACLFLHLCLLAFTLSPYPSFSFRFCCSLPGQWIWRKLVLYLEYGRCIIHCLLFHNFLTCKAVLHKSDLFIILEHLIPSMQLVLILPIVSL